MPLLGWLLLGCHMAGYFIWLLSWQRPCHAAPVLPPAHHCCCLHPHRENDESLRLGGFNMSTYFQPGVPLCDLVGTLDYLAPEVFSNSYSCQVGVGCMQVQVHLLMMQGQRCVRAWFNAGADARAVP